MFELLTHLLHNDHGERAVIVAFLTEHWPMLRVWLAARSEAHGSANRGATHTRS